LLRPSAVWPCSAGRATCCRADQGRPLLTNVEALDEIRVPLRVLRLQVIQQPAAASDEHQQPAARMMVFGVCLEVLGQVVDAFAEECNLDFRGAGVAVVGLITANQLGLAVFAQGHLCLTSTNAPEDRVSRSRGPAWRAWQPEAPYAVNSVTRARSTCYL